MRFRHLQYSQLYNVIVMSCEWSRLIFYFFFIACLYCCMGSSCRYLKRIIDKCHYLICRIVPIYPCSICVLLKIEIFFGEAQSEGKQCNNSNTRANIRNNLKSVNKEIASNLMRSNSIKILFRRELNANFYICCRRM